MIALLGRDALMGTINSISGTGVDVDENVPDYSGLVYTSAIIGGLTLLSSAFLLSFMIAFASILIKIALLFTVVLSVLGVVLCLWLGFMTGAIIGLILAAISACYAKLVWSRIPFATANLVTSLTAVKKNIGIIFVALSLSIIAIVWSVVWTIAFLGVYEATKVCDANQVCTMNYGYLFLLLISYYWTHQVITNTIQVTVAGLLGTWWFTPDEASCCCSSGVTGSLFRACTYAHGSICFGSLVVAIIQALRRLTESARDQGDGNAILLCIVECILGCIESLLEYFNKWAYTYVGLYGYGYLEAGKNVMALFRNRGWEAIITDDLVENVIFLLSLIVGLIMGGVALGFESYTDWFIEFEGGSKLVAFFLGLIVGLVLCSIMLNTVGSGVNAVIVLFAEAPAEFETNYPELSQKMRVAWSEAYPEVNFVN